MVAEDGSPAGIVTNIPAAPVHTSMGEEVQQVRGAMAATAVLAVQRLTLAPVAAGHVTVAILAEWAALAGL